MKTHLGSQFENTTVILDGQGFEACTFVECTIVFRGGALSRFSGNQFIRCQWRLEDAALRTLAFFGAIYRTGAASVIERWFTDIRGMSLLPESPEGPVH
jgi:hypothetical protein